MTTCAHDGCACDLYKEELMGAADMRVDGNCRGCGHPVGLHPRRPAGTSTVGERDRGKDDAILEAINNVHSQLSALQVENLEANNNVHSQLSALQVENLEAINNVHSQLSALQVEISTLQVEMAKTEVRHLRANLDCWHSTNRTRMECSVFKEALLTYYQCSSSTSADVRCMVTHELFPRSEVCASHIVKSATRGNTMHMYGLTAADIDSPRNGFLALKSIEEAFDRKEVCFLYNPITQKLKLKVLRPLLLEKKLRKDVTCTRKFRDVDDKELILPEGVFPFRRCLSMHAKLSYSCALNLQHIEPSDTLETYFNVSDGGLQEPHGMGELTWEEVHGAIYH